MLVPIPLLISNQHIIFLVPSLNSTECGSPLQAGLPVAKKETSSSCGAWNTVRTTSSHLIIAHSLHKRGKHGQKHCVCCESCSGFVHATRHLQHQTSDLERYNNSGDYWQEKTISMEQEKSAIAPTVFSLQKKGMVPQKSWEQQVTPPCSTPLPACGQHKK